jgi:multidrug efflux system outer membrane protein
MFRLSALVVLLAVIAGCAAVGPDFKAPETVSTAAYRHAGQAAVATLPTRWWRAFGDQRLNRLVETALEGSPTVRVAASRLVQAESLYRIKRADQLPALGIAAGVSTLRTSANSAQGIALHRTAIVGDQFTTGLSLSYELDLWGKIRRTVEGADAQALAARYDRDGVLLLLSSQVATTYWQLAGIDGEIAILEGALASRAETLQLVEARFGAGLTNELDVSRARIESSTAEADLHDARRQRYLLEHYLATLTGASPSVFLLGSAGGASGTRLPEPPAIPVGLPASLLGQRPDLAESVQILRAANARIGVAEAAFYPTIEITGNFGFASEGLQDLLKSGSRQFSYGPLSLTLPLFDGGRNKANLAYAGARYDEALGRHSELILNALREVEDALSDTQQRARQAAVLAQSQQAAARACAVARQRYEHGVANYLEVTDAQRSSLAADRAAVRTATQRLLAAVAVARALGGGWQGVQKVP